jgi:hypothetical protein
MTETMRTMAGSDQRVDLALARHRGAWLNHPVLGDPSWDTFARDPGNPVYEGRPPFDWPVNGFLFRDPPSGRWYAYVSLYPRGYWPPGGTLALREGDGGWEQIGLILEPSPRSFEGDGSRCGGVVDVSMVHDAGRYHLVYGWCDPDNRRGGLAYAWAERPEGPFHRAPRPLHEDTCQETLRGRYKRAYASTLIRRDEDWLILHMMSTPGNAGGTWALACMTARQAEGPYSAPRLLLMPQSDVHHPPLAEFYPQFAHGGQVYAPATSVALNRTFQVLFRAPVEEADMPEAWRIDGYGSLWHAEPVPSEAQGIWGQTFSGQVGPGGVLRAYFTSKTADDRGTVHLARRDWSRPYGDGFVLSAPRGPALAILPRRHRDFELDMRATADGPWAVCWDCAGPLGPDHSQADSTLHRLTRTRRVEWRLGLGSEDGWRLVVIGPDGSEEIIGREPGEGRAEGTGEAMEARVARAGEEARLSLGGREVWRGHCPRAGGRIELLAEAGTILRVARFALRGRSAPMGQFWLSTEALAGAAAEPDEWQAVEDSLFRFGVGHVSARPGARAKWNFTGSGFRLYAPRGPLFGACDVTVDGRKVATLDLRDRRPRRSAVVLEAPLAVGPHAVVLTGRSGTAPCDVIEVV